MELLSEIKSKGKSIAGYAATSKSTTIINLSREEIVDTDSIVSALEKEQIDTYVTDFPKLELIGNPDVLLMPHLGASTKEAEINCALMVANSLIAFLEDGNIDNEEIFIYSTYYYIL